MQRIKKLFVWLLIGNYKLKINNKIRPKIVKVKELSEMLNLKRNYDEHIDNLSMSKKYIPF